MAGLRFADLQSRPMEFLDLTSVTLDEFQQLVPPFEAAFQAHMAAWRMDGKPRTVPPVYRISELPSADARRSALVYSHLSQDLRPPGGARALVRDGPGQSPSVDPRALARAAGRAACPRRCPGPLPARSRPAPGPPWPSGSASRRLRQPPWSSRGRRHHVWPVSGSPMCRRAPWSSWI